MTANRFNLIDEPWIPVLSHKRVSLRQAFSEALPPLPGGSPFNKISVFKLLGAIDQAACTPKNDEEWLALGPQGLAKRVLTYLDRHYDAFFLHGARPFLQFRACAKAVSKPYGTAMPVIASGNTTRLFHQQVEPELSDADKALLLLEQQSLCLGGKKPDNKLVLSPGYEKKVSGKPGPALGRDGLLHSFLFGNSLLETLWLNLLTQEDIAGQKQWETGLGTPPWEEMPQEEDCPAARALKTSLMGRLVPMARFCLLDEGGLRFTEGIVHPDYQSGMVDPSAAVDASKTTPRALWVNPEIRPWRQLPALLSFLDAQQSNSGFYCLGLQKGLSRLTLYRDRCSIRDIGVWSGGASISSQSGEQYFSGKNDELESEYRLETEKLGSIWFRSFEAMVDKTEKLSRLLYGSVKRYWLAMKTEEKNARALAVEASNRFWRMVEPSAPDIIANCEDEEVRNTLLRRYYGLVLRLYDEACPHEEGRQLAEWSRYSPRSQEEPPVKNTESRYADLLKWISDRLGDEPVIKDKGNIARLKRADSSEHLAIQSWEILLFNKVEDRDFSPCLAIIAPMCRRNDPVDGTASLGRALASCSDDAEHGRSRLHRLLNCRDTEELCRLLRKLLSFVDSQKKEKLSYARLLEEVLNFRTPERQQEIKRRWSTDYWTFFPQTESEPDGEGA